jgi:predicted DNA-binding transcriptional regulator YafY
MNKKNTTAKELCEHFEVSQRTIYRDIDTLCQAGIPIYTSKGKGGGISLMENFVLNKSVLSEEEQKEILSALNGFQAATNTDTNQVLSKLNALFGDKQANWIEVDFSNWNRNDGEKLKFNQLKDAILNRSVVSFKYYNSTSQVSQRTVEPYKLIFRGQAWYLYGYCRDKKAFRCFKTTRIRELILQKEHYTNPPRNAPKKMEAPALPSLPTIEVKLRIDGKLGYRIYDEFPIEAITQCPDGSFLIQTDMNSGSWLYGYLMSYEDHIEVIEPIELREKLVQIYKNALNKNII